MNDLETFSKDSSPLRRYVLVLAGLVLTVFCLHSLASMLQPIFLALYLCYFALPLRDLLHRCKIPLFLANALVPILMVLFFIFLGWLIAGNLETLTANLPRYEEQARILAESISEFLRSLHPVVRKKLDALPPMSEIAFPVETLGRYVSIGVGSFFSFLSGAFVVGFYMIFLLLESKDFSNRLKRSFGAAKGQDLIRLFERIKDGIMVYNRVKSLLSFLVGSITTAVLLVFQVDSAILWGVLTFFANFIPYLGPIAVTVPPVVLFYFQTGDLFLTGMLTAILVGAHSVIGHFLEPKITGSSLNLSALVVVISLAFWAWLWGIIGMALAVPVLVAVKMALEGSPKTHGVAVLLGGQKP